MIKRAPYNIDNSASICSHDGLSSDISQEQIHQRLQEVSLQKKRKQESEFRFQSNKDQFLFNEQVINELYSYIC